MVKQTILSWVFQVLVAAILAPMIGVKFAGRPEAVELFTALGMEPAGRYLIGALELLVLVLLLTPRAAAWGAVLGWGVMTGALIAHATHLGVEGMMLPLTLMAALNWLGCTAVLILRRRQIEFIREMFPGEEEKMF